jgi:vacuolar-type H+-ATPase subunit H
LARKPVRRVDSPRGRRSLDGLVIAVGVIVLIFAVVGVATAGTYLAGKVSGKPTSTPLVVGTTVNGNSSRAVALAHAQATAIVEAAKQSKKQILTKAASRARNQAQSIISTARRTAANVKAAAASHPTAPAPSSTNATSSSTTASAYPTSTPVYNAYAYPTSTPVTATSPATTAVGNPNLSGVPASWLVVGYGATFGAGPGSAGSVSVVNRGSKAFSGTVSVVYATGGRATASFSGIAPGQSLVLPLNGPAYKGGGYSIHVSV